MMFGSKILAWTAQLARGWQLGDSWWEMLWWSTASSRCHVQLPTLIPAYPAEVSTRLCVFSTYIT